MHYNLLCYICLECEIRYDVMVTGATLIAPIDGISLDECHRECVDIHSSCTRFTYQHSLCFLYAEYNGLVDSTGSVTGNDQNHRLFMTFFCALKFFDTKKRGKESKQNSH